MSSPSKVADRLPRRELRTLRREGRCLGRRHLKSRYLTMSSVALLAAMAASSAVSTFMRHSPRLRTPAGTAHLYVIGTRSEAQRASAVGRRLDSILADLSRHASRA